MGDAARSYLIDRGLDKGPVAQAFGRFLREHRAPNPGSRDGIGFDNEVWEMRALGVALLMEDMANLIKSAGVELEQARTQMEDFAGEVQALGAVIEPALLKQTQALRAARMTAVTEVRESLVALRDIRKFFLEADYETEMLRLERFVAVCRELQALKASGVFDAVCDSALRLALQDKER